MPVKQKTIKKPVTLSGKGLHTGIEVELTLCPAPENHGLVFQRTDLPDNPKVNAIVENVIDTSRGTTVAENGVSVKTIEHLLATFTGLEIDNVLMKLKGPEVPIMDGSAKYFVEALKNAGIVNQEAEKYIFHVKNKIVYTDKKSDVEIIAYPDEHLNLDVLIDYKSEVLGNQYANINSINNFEGEIASSRTFVFFHELETLLKNNLIKGGDLENAIVIMENLVPQKELDRIADLFNKPRVKVKPNGILSNVDLHFSNEPARHKLLDLMGDLSLIGYTIKGKIIASRPGHRSNVEFAKKIKRTIKEELSMATPPVYNPNDPPLLNINDIKKLLPHRYPFLLIDKILHLDENTVVGLKNVTMNEEFFNGHFPGEPVMPGVLQIEAMAQVGGILALNSVPDPENYLTLFLKIEHVKFRKQIVPGDTIIFKLELKTPIRRGIVHMAGLAFVGNKVAMEGEMIARIIKVNE